MNIQYFGLLAAAGCLSLAGFAHAAEPAARPPMTVAARAANIRTVVKDIPITDAMVAAHVMRPARPVFSDEDLGETAPILTPLDATGPGPVLKNLDVTAFSEALHAKLKDSVAGYSMQIRRDGKTAYNLQWTKNDGPAWNADRRMHVASVSKMVTAMATMKLLIANQNVGLDSKIINYLPKYWVKGPNVEKITFEDLLTHRSGFNIGGSESDYEAMKEQIEKGVYTDNKHKFKYGDYHYKNTNFGLLRILIPIVNKNISKTALGDDDDSWDLVTILYYEAYVRANVFLPAGVHNATLTHGDNDALAYEFPVDDGWDSGDMSSMSGGAGWHMSAKELLRVMHAFRWEGKIVSRTWAERSIASLYGFDWRVETAAGPLYAKNGLWQDAKDQTKHVEQALVVFMPDHMELVVLVNSPVGMSKRRLSTLVFDTYKANLH